MNRHLIRGLGLKLGNSGLGGWRSHSNEVPLVCGARIMDCHGLENLIQTCGKASNRKRCSLVSAGTIGALHPPTPEIKQPKPKP